MMTLKYLQEYSQILQKQKEIKLKIPTMKALINQLDDSGKNFLHLASEYGDKDMLELLLANEHINVNQVDCDGNIPLGLAIRNSNLEIIKLLLANEYINVNQVDGDGNSPLGLAIRNSNLDVMNFLIKKGAKVNQVDGDGNSPLGLAIRNSNLDVMNFLIKKGANVNQVDGDGNSPLGLAIRNSNLDVMNFLIKKGANVNQDDDFLEGTPLDLAIASDNKEILISIIEKGAKNIYKFFQFDEYAKKAIYKSLNEANREGDVVVKFLISKMSKEAIDEHYLWSKNFLHLASESGNNYIVKSLLDRQDIDVNIVDEFNGRTALFRAIYSGHLEIVKLLLDRQDIDVNIRGKDNFTPLLWAVQNHQHEIVKLLMQLGKCDLTISAVGNFGARPVNNDIWTYYKDYPESLIEILKMKPYAFKSYRENIKKIGEEKNCPFLLSDWGKVTLNFNDLVSYSIEGKKGFVISPHDVNSSIISMRSVVEFLDYQSAFNLYQALDASKIASNPLGLYKILYTNFDKITLTLQNGSLHPLFKESIDFVWNEPKNSFDYYVDEQNNQDIIEIAGYNPNNSDSDIS